MDSKANGLKMEVISSNVNEPRRLSGSFSGVLGNIAQWPLASCKNMLVVERHTIYTFWDIYNCLKSHQHL